MLAWMLYVVMVSLLLSVGAFLAERAARLKRVGTRWIWVTAIVASLVLPTIITSVTFELPDVLGEAASSKYVSLRQATSQHLSPAVWITGSAEPATWRSSNDVIKRVWLGVSIAMLVALVASGGHLLLRKRRWNRETVAGAAVLVTDDIGPAVVGLMRPRIVVPRWVTLAPPTHQAAVIAHEQSHLEARDPHLFTLALALLVFMPWNLPLWWQLRRLRYAIEIDCDARVLKGGVDPAHYGETLIAVGERQSAYVGAVAAMSESKSFLEERIEHMFRKPVRWRRLGAATLVSFSLAVTALAAQVSPPNADTPAPVAGTPPKTERKAITLDHAVLDRYVGSYKLGDTMILTVKREGENLQAQLTGQQFIEMYPESDTRFFYKAIDAQLEFKPDSSGGAESVTLFQNGNVVTMPRVDTAVAQQIQADLAAKIASGVPTPGSEAALRRLSDGIASGKPDYSEMSPFLADALKQQLPGMQPGIASLGPLKSVTFRNVTGQGHDLYLATYEKGTLAWRISMSPDGKIANALVTPDF
jgi:beta-lactamase regulating signal transducer with metallopeptidase domain